MRTFKKRRSLMYVVFVLMLLVAIILLIFGFFRANKNNLWLEQHRLMVSLKSYEYAKNRDNNQAFVDDFFNKEKGPILFLDEQVLKRKIDLIEQYFDVSSLNEEETGFCLWFIGLRLQGLSDESIWQTKSGKLITLMTLLAEVNPPKYLKPAWFDSQVRLYRSNELFKLGLVNYPFVQEQLKILIRSLNTYLKPSLADGSNLYTRNENSYFTPSLLVVIKRILLLFPDIVDEDTKFLFFNDYQKYADPKFKTTWKTMADIRRLVHNTYYPLYATEKKPLKITIKSPPSWVTAQIYLDKFLSPHENKSFNFNDHVTRIITDFFNSAGIAVQVVDNASIHVKLSLTNQLIKQVPYKQTVYHVPLESSVTSFEPNWFILENQEIVKYKNMLPREQQLVQKMYPEKFIKTKKDSVSYTSKEIRQIQDMVLPVLSVYLVGQEWLLPPAVVVDKDDADCGATLNHKPDFLGMQIPTDKNKSEFEQKASLSVYMQRLVRIFKAACSPWYYGEDENKQE